MEQIVTEYLSLKADTYLCAERFPAISATTSADFLNTIFTTKNVAT